MIMMGIRIIPTVQMQITGRMVVRRVHPHSDVGHSLAATFDASSSSTTASSHISMDTPLFSLKFGQCIKICFYSYFMYKKQNSTQKCDGKCAAIITINE